MSHGHLPPHHGSDHRSRAKPRLLRGPRLPLLPRHGYRQNGELEATNYFFSLANDENVPELTYNHDGRTYDLGTAYGHIAAGVDDLDGTLAALKD